MDNFINMHQETENMFVQYLGEYETMEERLWEQFMKTCNVIVEEIKADEFFANFTSWGDFTAVCDDAVRCAKNWLAIENNMRELEKKYNLCGL